MTRLILPSRFSQPQQAAPIDRSNPLTTNITFAFNAAAGLWDSVTNKPGTQNAGSGSNPFTIAGIGGVSRKYTTASANEDSWAGISDAASARTVACLCSYASVPGLDALILKGGFNDGWGLKVNSSGAMRLCSNTSSFTITDPATLTANTLFLFVGVFDNTNAFLYKNGYLAISAAYGGVANTAGLNLGIGHDEGVGTGSLANVYGAWVWDRALSAVEVLQFSANPWQIWTAPRRKLWLNVPGGGAVNNKTLTASISSTGTVIRSIGAIRSASQANTASIIRSIAATRTATQGSTAKAVKSINTVKSATQGNAATAPKQMGVIKAATQSSSALLSRVIGAIRTVTQSSTASIIRSIIATRTATQGNAATAVKSINTVKSATQGNTATAPKQIGAIRSSSITTVPVISRAISLIRNATQSSVASVIKTINKMLSASSGLVATLGAIKVKIVVLSASIGSSALVIKSVGLIRTSVLITNSLLQKAMSKTLFVVSTFIASIAALKVRIVVLSANISLSASKILSVNIVRLMAIVTSATLSRAISVTHAAAIVLQSRALKMISKTVSSSIVLVARISAIFALIILASKKNTYIGIARIRTFIGKIRNRTLD